MGSDVTFEGMFLLWVVSILILSVIGVLWFSRRLNLMTMLVAVSLMSLIAVLVLFSGCASTPYVKPDATAQEDARVEVECRRDAELGVPQGGILRGVVVEQRYRRCLQGRGYAPQAS